MRALIHCARRFQRHGASCQHCRSWVLQGRTVVGSEQILNSGENASVAPTLIYYQFVRTVQYINAISTSTINPVVLRSFVQCPNGVSRVSCSLTMQPKSGPSSSSTPADYARLRGTHPACTSLVIISQEAVFKFVDDFTHDDAPFACRLQKPCEHRRWLCH